MLFAIGSITKNMVASLTLQLAEEGVLSLEDSLGVWLQAYPNIDDRVTIRQLLNHTSGIYQYFSNQAIWDEMERDPARVWTHEEVLTYVLEPYFPPGEGFRYSNTNYTLLGMIIEKATGATVGSELRRRFWEPLGLSRTYFAIEEEIPDNVAHVWGSQKPGGEAEDLTRAPRAAHDSIIHPSGGVFATAEDLARWSDALFGGEVIGESQLDEMLEFVRLHRRSESFRRVTGSLARRRARVRRVGSTRGLESLAFSGRRFVLLSQSPQREGQLAQARRSAPAELGQIRRWRHPRLPPRSAARVRPARNPALLRLAVCHLVWGACLPALLAARVSGGFPLSFCCFLFAHARGEGTRTHVPTGGIGAGSVGTRE
jgi:CubicO group peptidase (beta-lactamase class C family)